MGSEWGLSCQSQKTISAKQEFGHKQIRHKKELARFARRLVAAVYRFSGQLQLHRKFPGLFLVVRNMGQYFCCLKRNPAASASPLMPRHLLTMSMR